MRDLRHATRTGRVVRLLGQPPVAGPTRRLPQLPQLPSQPLDRIGIWIQWTFRCAHRTPLDIDAAKPAKRRPAWEMCGW
jgi:hypothetical protein